MRRVVCVLLVAVGALVPRSSAAQTPDPLVLCGCAATAVVGWEQSGDCSQPLSTPDLGWSATSTALANPPRYFEHQLTAPAGAYRIWLRVSALGDSKWNDAVWVQFSDALNASNQPIYRIGTTSGLLVNLASDGVATSLRGWGWVNGAYWLMQTTTVRFATSGPHTIRVQVREDGVSVDQIILSAATYSTTAPGPITDDQTRFACPAAPVPAPGLPADPAPAAEATDVTTDVSVAWSAAANAVSYDVAFGTVDPPPVVSSNQTASSYQPAALSPATTYYWAVVAKNATGSTPGPVWSFTTAPPPPPAIPPGVVTNPVPVHGSVDVGAGVAVAWTAATDATSYDVAFGTADPPPLVSAGQTTLSYQPGALLLDTAYFWTVTARHAAGSTPGPMWSFRTASAPSPAPDAVSTPAPADRAIDVGVTTALSWGAALHATTYDVAFGSTNPPPVVSVDQVALSYQPAGLASGTTYFSSVVAKNGSGETSGPVWSFTTAAPAAPPAEPVLLAPADLATEVAPTTGLSWLPSAGGTAYDVRLGTSDPPPIVSEGQSGTTYQPTSPLTEGVMYFWQVVAHEEGGVTAGPLWRFTTEAAPPSTGDAPSVANTNLHRLRVMTWNVKLGYNLENNTNDYALQIDMMAGLHPDVICLQEVSLSDTDMPTRLLEGLSARTGRTWRGLYQRGNAETTPTTNNTGSMILTWLPVDELSSNLLTTGVSQPFAELHLQVTVNGVPVHVTTTHLYAGDAGVRAAQLGVLQPWLASQGSRHVVAGDFNADASELSLWTAGWNTEYVDAWETATSWTQPTYDGGYTFDRRTATQNPERIDYHWTRGMNVSEAFVVKTRRSDHHAMVVDYRLP